MVYRLSDAQYDRFSNPYSFRNTPRLNYGAKSPYTDFSMYPQYPQAQPQKEKVGFWEGTKALVKGIFKPIAEIAKHPIKSGLMIAATAALVIGTGGAATPFLLAGGFALGGWQVAKGTYGAITSNNREETLANLENIGSGTFAVAASAVGAKTYMSTTAVGSATATASQQVGFWAKAGAYAKGLGQDAWSVIKMAPNSVKSTLAMVKSGQFMGNLQSAYSTSKLSATARKDVAKARLSQQKAYQEYKAISQNPNANIESTQAAFDKWQQATQAYKAKLTTYDAAKAKIDAAAAVRQEKVFNKYVDMANAKNSPVIQENAIDLLENGFVKGPRITRRTLLDLFNPAKNNTTENMGLALNGNIGTVDEQLEQQFGEMMPYAEAAFGTM